MTDQRLATIEQRLESLLLHVARQSQKNTISGSDTPRPAGHGEPSLSQTTMAGESILMGQRLETRLRRLELPLFDGTNPDGWVCQAERYFMMHQMSDQERLAASIINLDSDSLSWFQWEDSRRAMPSWGELKR